MYHPVQGAPLQAMAVVGAVVSGGGDPARSNRLMRWRVILQGAALLLLALLMTLLRHS